MVRKIVFCIAFVLALMGTQGVFAQQVQENTSQKLTEQSALTLTITGNTVRIQNASPGSQFEVYNVLGIRVLAVKLDAADKTYTLNLSKGCYILKIENLVRKVALK